MFFVVFMFKHETAYEMRISDWSSDVCSSDLLSFVERIELGAAPLVERERACALSTVAARTFHLSQAAQPVGDAPRQVVALRRHLLLSALDDLIFFGQCFVAQGARFLFGGVKDLGTSIA